VRRREAGPQGRLHRVGRQEHRAGRRRPRRGRRHPHRRAGDCAPQAAAPAADLLLGGARGSRPVRRGPKLAFNWDGGDTDKITLGATGAYRLAVEIAGLASHAGGAPEKGISAIAVAALAIASLHKDGWHGDINKNGSHGTSNVGVIEGGVATNVVTDKVRLRAEARSHDPKFRKQIVKAIESAFQKAAGQVKNDAGKTGKVKIETRADYESFLLPDDSPAVLAAEAALRSIGSLPFRAVTNGGLDANWMVTRGIPTVTLGCGQMEIHTVSEKLDVAAYQRACRIALRLATASE
jgi:tripeptide aminopeptidase